MIFMDPNLASADHATATFFFRFLFKLSGFINVVLILTTRPNVLLFGSKGLLSPNDPRYQLEQGSRIEAEDNVPEVPLTPFGGPSTGSTDEAFENRSPFKTEF
jgi:hypothetical protein